MGLVKDKIQMTDGMKWTWRLVDFFSVKDWARVIKWRKQRASRGWSDKDTWAAGEYIARVTVEMLDYLNKYSYIEWSSWFENVDNRENYKDLQEVIDDIQAYLDFTETSWAEGLDIDEESPCTSSCSNTFWCKDGKRLTDKQITALIKKHRTQEAKLYKKATKAMTFFARNFASFWD